MESKDPTITQPPNPSPNLIDVADASFNAAREVANESGCRNLVITYNNAGDYQFRISQSLDPADALGLLLSVCRDISRFCARHPPPTRGANGESAVFIVVADDSRKPPGVAPDSPESN